MRVIAKGKEPNTTLWNNPPFQEGMYRLMRYHVRTESDEGTLLFNTVTGELVLLSKEEKELLDCLPAPYEAKMGELASHRFLVPDSFDELLSVIQLRKVIHSLAFQNKEGFGFTILPTTACNARCFYCYESDYPRHTMTSETCDKVVDYIDSIHGKAKNVHLNWFGGEPTLGEKSIDRICDFLSKKGIGFTSSMISNGYLFTKEMVKKAKEKWRLGSVQITLDGTEEVYNRVKAYVNPINNPFRRVLDNITNLLEEGIHVSIRMNLDRHNADDLKILIDKLAERFGQNDCLSIYAHEIFEGMGSEPIHRSENELRYIIEVKQSLESYIETKGMRRAKKESISKLPSLQVYFCMADNPSAVLINPDGKIGKCQHYQYSHLCGDLINGIIDKKELSYWMDYKPRDGCVSCPLLPVCGVPQVCECGRACIPVEKEQRINSVKSSCIAYIHQQ